MTISQQNAERCGLIPEDNPPEFFAKHLSAYHFFKRTASKMKILEVGFGDGYGMNYLAEEAFEVTGLDIAPKNIPLAQKKYPSAKLKFIHFDGYRIPFEGPTFDQVCSFQVIEHIPEDKLLAWLFEIKRVLKPGGLFCVSTLNLLKAQKPGVPYYKNIDHEKEFTPEDLKVLLEKVFPKVEMFGLFYTTRHRLFRRFKKWGFHQLPFVRNHFKNTTVKEFCVKTSHLAQSIDLIAVCRPQTT